MGKLLNAKKVTNTYKGKYQGQRGVTLPRW